MTSRVYGLRFLVLLGALTAYRVSLVVKPLYRARPMILLEPVSILIPPRVGLFLLQTALVLLVILLVESLCYAKALKVGRRRSCAVS